MSDSETVNHITLNDRLNAISSLQRNAQGWKERSLSAGETLFEQGEHALALFVLVEGRVGVLVDGASIDELGPGESLGEASVFSHTERRQASVVARTDCRLLVLQRTRVMDLRKSSAPTYDWLLEAALAEIWGRLERRDREIVRIGGDRLEPPPPRGALSSLWRRLRTKGSKAPDMMQTLARVAGLERLPPTILESIAIELVPQRVPADSALFLQGELERELHIVADGKLAIVRENVAGEPQELIVLEPGALFGAGGFIARQPRSASAVARTDCWVLSLSRETAEVFEQPVRRHLYEALLATLRSQLRAANTLMASLLTPEQRLVSSARAVGHLQGWQPNEPLAAVELDELAEHEPDSVGA